MMTEKRISLWSGPRNVSTAIMYSFAQRPDTSVLDEPLYGHYLRVTGVDHPGRDEVMSSMNLQGPQVVQDLCNLDYGSPVLFIKNMAHHLVDLNFSFLDDLHNILLIRDPREMLPSVLKQIEKPTLRDTGLKQQWELYCLLTDQGDNPVVIDSKELLLSPQSMLVKICHLLDIPYFEEMLSWKPGPIDEDGVWAKHWYHNVHNSTGFQPYKSKEETVPEELTELWRECDKYYQKLYQQAIVVSD